MCVRIPTLLILAYLSHAISSVGLCTEMELGRLEDSTKKIEQLKKIGEKLPVEFYDVPYRQFIQDDGGAFVPYMAGNMDLEPFSGDWMPLQGSNFNTEPFQSIALQLTKSPGLFSHRELLAPWVREIGENFLKGRHGKEDSSTPLTVITKLNLLNEWLKTKKKTEFDFREIIEPGVTFPDSGSFKSKYFAALGNRGLHYFYEPGVPQWWGFCDRMAVANLNRGAQRLLSGFSGAFCGNIPISRSDLEDMVSLFHSLPDSWTRHGKNRGNLTEDVSISPQMIYWEETLGERPLAPKVLMKLLTDNVGQKRAGLIIDESSFPKDPVYSYDGIWNRPVFEYSIARSEKAIKASEIEPLLVARYSNWFSAILHEDFPKIRVISEEWKSSALRADTAFNKWLTSVYSERAVASEFKSASQLDQWEPPNKSEKDYRDAVRVFKDRTNDFWNEVKNVTDRVKSKNELGLNFVTWKITVRFPRQRTEWTGFHPQLYERTYFATELAYKDGHSPMSWNAFQGDYPPDLAIVPVASDPRNLERLRIVLDNCTSLKTIENTASMITNTEKRSLATVTRNLASNCAMRYLSADAVQRQYKSFGRSNEGDWKKRYQKCLSEWPDQKIDSDLNEPSENEYTFR